jgi:hypothetical protein
MCVIVSTIIVNCLSVVDYLTKRKKRKKEKRTKKKERKQRKKLPQEKTNFVFNI